VRIERCDGGAALDALRSEWTALHAEGAEHNPFLRWEWLVPSWRRLTPGRSPRVYLARDDDGRLRGLLPLSVERRRLRFLGDVTIGSDGLDALVGAGGEEARARLWEQALDDGGWDVAELLDLEEGSPSVAALHALAAARGVRVDERARYRCPRIDLVGAAPNFVRKLPRGETVQRRRRWFERQGGASISLARSPAEVTRAIEPLIDLHLACWASRGGSQAFTSPQVAAFHRDAVVRLAERDAVRLYTLRVAERPVASLYVLREHGVHAMYQSGWDPEWAERSPGMCLLARSLEDAIADGARAYDFLRGDEAYKLEWANGERRTVALRLVRPTAAGRLRAAAGDALRAARARALGLLPPEGVAALRRVRSFMANRRVW
jgi:CelD/BcsL family acetyltransferase involved in cellulose biosynthesis